MSHEINGQGIRRIRRGGLEMTVEDLREKTSGLEETLHNRIDDFERLFGADVVEVQILEPYQDRKERASRKQEVKVLLKRPYPQGFKKREKKILEREIRTLMRRYERETGCRVTEVLVGLEGYPVEVRIDALAYPQRLLQRSKKDLEEEIAGRLDGFTGRTQGRIARIDIVGSEDETYGVRVSLA
jgi:hypothetical protein